MAGLICGDETVAVPIAERRDGGLRSALATLTANRAGTWGLGVYVQTVNQQCGFLKNRTLITCVSVKSSCMWRGARQVDLCFCGKPASDGAVRSLANFDTSERQTKVRW